MKLNSRVSFAVQSAAVGALRQLSIFLTDSLKEKYMCGSIFTYYACLYINLTFFNKYFNFLKRMEIYQHQLLGRRRRRITMANEESKVLL